MFVFFCFPASTANGDARIGERLVLTSILTEGASSEYGMRILRVKTRDVEERDESRAPPPPFCRDV